MLIIGQVCLQLQVHLYEVRKGEKNCLFFVQINCVLCYAAQEGKPFTVATETKLWARSGAPVYLCRITAGDLQGSSRHLLLVYQNFFYLK